MHSPLRPLALVKKNDGRYILQPMSGEAAGGGSFGSPPAPPSPEDGGGRGPGSASAGSSAGRLYHSSSSPSLHRWAVHTDGVDLSTTAGSPWSLSGSRRFSGTTPRASKADDAAGHLRGKLLDTGSSLVGFDKKMEDDTRRRVEIGQQQLHEVLVSLARLEKTLSKEAAHRTQDTKNMQQSVQRLLGEMADRIQSKLLERFEHLGLTMNSLCQRCATLERGIQQLKGELPSKLRVETDRLKRVIAELHGDIETDARRCAETDVWFLRAVDEAKFMVDRQVEHELLQTERRSEAMHAHLEELGLGESEAGERRRNVVFGALDALKTSLADEGRSREQTDDKVVLAINDYAGTLHRSLQVASS